MNPGSGPHNVTDALILLEIIYSVVFPTYLSVS